jgi:hypothetical protein
LAAIDGQKAAIGELAQEVLEARALFPASSLADLYDPIAMPPKLLKAHQSLDRAVMKLYGVPVGKTTEVVQSIETRHPWFSGHGNWAIEVKFYDEPDVTYFYGVENEKIVFSKAEGDAPDNKPYKYLFDFQENAEKMDTPLPAAYSYFADEKNAIIIGIGDQAMGTYALQVYGTSDGGKTWSLRTENESGFIAVNIAAEYLFLSLDVGFIQNPGKGGDYSRLLMTTNGGKTFDEIHMVYDALISPANGVVSIHKNEVYDYIELPTFENGGLTVAVSQGADGDFNGGKTALEYQSLDMGETWKFVGETKRAQTPEAHARAICRSSPLGSTATHCSVPFSYSRQPIPENTPRHQMGEQ